MSWVSKAILLIIISFFTTSSFGEVYLKERLEVAKKQNKLVRKGSNGKSVNVKLISRKKYTKKKKYKKKTVKNKKKKASKRKTARKTKKKSKKKIISSMKTCVVYKPPGKKSTVVVEATSAKRKTASKKRCRTYRVTKKNGHSYLIIEVDENQI